MNMKGREETARQTKPSAAQAMAAEMKNISVFSRLRPEKKRPVPMRMRAAKMKKIDE